MGADVVYLLLGKDTANQPIFEVRLRNNAGEYQVSAYALNDSGAWKYTAWYPLPISFLTTNTWSAVEIDYQALANDGSIALWVDGVLQETSPRIDNATRTVGAVHLGLLEIDGTTGELFFDDFETRRFSYIGKLPDPGVEDPGPGIPGEGWFPADYAYNGEQPHAVTSVARGTFTDTYVYDQNGNMTCRVEAGDIFNQMYNAENRIGTIQKLEVDSGCPAPNTSAAIEDIDAQWMFAYDGDGNRITTLYDDGSTQTLTQYYFGDTYEVTGILSDDTFTATGFRKYYSLAGQTVAMRDADGLKYFLTDHLGSTLAVLDANGTVLEQQRYLPFGKPHEPQGYATIGLTDYDPQQLLSVR